MHEKAKSVCFICEIQICSIKHETGLVIIYRDLMCGEGGTLYFFLIRWLGPSISCLPTKNIRHTLKIFEILVTLGSIILKSN